MTEKETFEYIDSLQALGSHLGLSSVRELCKRIGDPQDELNIIHVAGTNGKGSIVAMVSQTLTACGYRTGRYISPVITDYRERFQINGRMISKKSLCRYVERLKEVCETMVQDGLEHPTPFEFETALAFLYFKEKGCDVVVLETGMGGLTDATNIIKKPLVCVFASISMDHMQFLGKTLSAIASVKAGIIKETVPVVSYPQKPEAMEVLQKEAEVKKAELTVVDATKAKLLRVSGKGIRFQYGSHGKMLLSLGGTYQLFNAATALEVLDCLRSRYGFSITEEKIKETFSQIVWPARFEKISSGPDVYIDGAHNEDAAVQLAKTIAFYKEQPSFTNKKIIYIMGVLKDKEYGKIIRETYSFADMIITVKTPHNERALDAYELARAVVVYHSNVTAADGLSEAVEMAYLMGGKDAVIIAFGSLSYLGELKQIIQDNKWTRRDSHGK